MRLAWFAPEASDVALELGGAHVVDQFNEGRSHEFVWRHFRQPYDLTIFELSDTPAYAFLWPYLFHYPGVVVLRAASLQRSRSTSLLAAHRQHHFRAERAFSGRAFLRAPLMASRMVVVHDSGLARDLAAEFPEIDARVVPVGVAAAVTSSNASGKFVIVGSRRDVAERAAVRAREAGVDVVLTDAAGGLTDADVVVELEWPPEAAPPDRALRAMAAGIPAIVLETEAVAAWPTLDPQTWQPRGYCRDVTPVAISIDPRDEEHSLMLAIRRLSADESLRRSLSAAARAWTREHASVTTAASHWEAILKVATAHPPIARPAALPPHLTEDGTRTAHGILDEMGVTVDILEASVP